MNKIWKGYFKRLAEDYAYMVHKQVRQSKLNRPMAKAILGI